MCLFVLMQIKYNKLIVCSVSEWLMFSNAQSLTRNQHVYVYQLITVTQIFFNFSILKRTLETKFLRKKSFCNWHSCRGLHSRAAFDVALFPFRWCLSCSPSTLWEEWGEHLHCCLSSPLKGRNLFVAFPFYCKIMLYSINYSVQTAQIYFPHGNMVTCSVTSSCPCRYMLFVH